MPRLYLLTLVLIFFCGSALVTVRLTASTTTSPIAAVFTTPDGSPCYRPCLFGIQPSVTKAEEVNDILQSHPLVRDFEVISEKIFRVQILEQPQVNLTIATIGDVVDAIYLSTGPAMGQATDNTLGFLAQPVSIGDVVVFAGMPSGVIYQRIGRDTLVYTFDWLGVSVPQAKTKADRLDVTSPVSGIGITSWSACPNDEASVPITKWLGFTTIERYDRIPYSRIQLHSINFSNGFIVFPCISTNSTLTPD